MAYKTPYQNQYVKPTTAERLKQRQQQKHKTYAWGAGESSDEDQQQHFPQFTLNADDKRNPDVGGREIEDLDDCETDEVFDIKRQASFNSVGSAGISSISSISSYERGQVMRSLSNGSELNQEVNRIIEMQPTNYRKIYDKCWAEFTNLGYLHDQDDCDEVDHAIRVLMKQAKGSAKNLIKWKTHYETVKENEKEMKDEIESRRRNLMDLINKHTDKMLQKLNMVVESHIDHTMSVVTNLEDALNDVQTFTENKFKTLQKEGDIDKLKGNLTLACSKLENCNIGAPSWQQMELVTPNEKSNYFVSTLFGSIKGGGIENNKWLRSETAEDEFELNLEKATKGECIEKPEHQLTFVARSHKDKRETGITDVAITSNNEAVVCDKHNKLVKMFDSGGKLIKFIGKDSIREPSRVSILEGSEHILVTDSGNRTVKIFNRQGDFITDFVSDLKYPASHCSTHDGNIAILEFETKCIIKYDGRGKQISVFNTEMECPAYMTCTKSGNFVVSDWRTNLLRFFDAVGNVIQDVKGLGKTNDKLNQPYGVHADIYGHVLVADRLNLRVQVFTEDGEFVQSYDKTMHNFKCPYGVTSNKYGLLVVAEYSGNIKYFKYLDIDMNAIPSKNGGHGQNKRVGSKLRNYEHDDHDEDTVC